MHMDHTETPLHPLSAFQRNMLMLATIAMGAGMSINFVVVAPLTRKAGLGEVEVAAILTLSTLGFVGVGIQPPTPELGLMMTEALPHYQEAPRLLLAPILVMGVMLLALVLLNQKGTLHPGSAQGVTP